MQPSLLWGTPGTLDSLHEIPLPKSGNSAASPLPTTANPTTQSAIQQHPERARSGDSNARVPHLPDDGSQGEVLPPVPTPRAALGRGGDGAVGGLEDLGGRGCRGREAGFPQPGGAGGDGEGNGGGGGK